MQDNQSYSKSGKQGKPGLASGVLQAAFQWGAPVPDWRVLGRSKLRLGSRIRLFRCQSDEGHRCAPGPSGWAPAHSLIVLAFLACSLIPSRDLAAENSAAAPDYLSHRYVLMIENSRTMAHWTHGVSAAINEILDSGLRSEGRSGDMLSVWTFNEDFNKNLCPQIELPLDPQAGFATQVIKAFQGQANDKKASLEKIVPEINALARQSDFVTVILVSAGDADLHGTPFDARINQSFRKWQEEQKKARMPFVTVLRVGHGKFTHCSITPAQWPLELPPFPRELQFVPGKPARKQIEPPGKGPKSEGPQLAEVKPQVSESSNTFALGGSKNEIKAAPAINSAPAQEVAKTTPILTPPPTPVMQRKENPKPAAMVAAPKSPAALPADWKPFGETLSDWLASATPSAPERGISSPQQAPKPDNAPVKTGDWSKIAADKSVPAPAAAAEIARPSESRQLALADWQPLEEAMKGWRIEENLPKPAVPRIEPEPQKRTAQTSATVAKPIQPSGAELQRTDEPVMSVKKSPALASVVDAKAAGTSDFLSPALSSGEEKTSATSPTVAEAISTAAHVPEAEQAVLAAVELPESTRQASAPSTPATAIAMRDEPVRPVENVWRKNAGALVVMLGAAIAAAFCFLNWFRTISRPDTEESAVMSLTPEGEIQPERHQLEAAELESAPLEALLNTARSAVAGPARQPTSARSPRPSTVRATSGKLAEQAA